MRSSEHSRLTGTRTTDQGPGFPFQSRTTDQSPGFPFGRGRLRHSFFFFGGGGGGVI